MKISQKKKNQIKKDYGLTGHPLRLDNIFLHAVVDRLVEQNAHHE